MMEYIHHLHLRHKLDHELRHLFRALDRILGPIIDPIPLWVILGVLCFYIIWLVYRNESQS